MKPPWTTAEPVDPEQKHQKGGAEHQAPMCPPLCPPPPLQPVGARLSRHSGTAPRLPAAGQGQRRGRIPKIGVFSGEKPNVGCNKLAPCSLCNRQHPKRCHRRKEPTASAQLATERGRGGVGRGQRPSNCLFFLLCC